MKTHNLVALAAILTVSACGFAAEKKIQRSDLPPAVEKALQQQAQGATIKGFSVDKENGVVSYEAEMIVNGHSKDIDFDSNGKILVVEEEVVLASLPAEARTALTAKAGSGKITKVESLTKRNVIVAYEAQVVTNGKRSEIQVGPKGQKLSHEE